MTEDIDEHPIGGLSDVSQMKGRPGRAARRAAHRVAPTINRIVGAVDRRIGLSQRADAVAARRVPPVETVDSTSEIFLTFDDGPHPGYTEQICSLLERRGHRATFFLTGRNVEASPELAGRMAAAGHGIGSHSFGHRQQWNNSGPVILADYMAGHMAVRKAIGFSPRVFRPPYGHQDWRCGLFSASLRLTHYGWSAEGKDWQPGVAPSDIVDEIGDSIAPGQIVLLHDAIMDNPEAGDRTATVQAVDLLLDRLEAAGLTSAALPGSQR